MADYNESSVTGTSYQRCYRMVIDNPLGGEPTVTCREEQVLNLSDGTQAHTPIGPDIMESFTAENASETFVLRDPATGAESEVFATYGDLYLALYSAYWHLALKRDGVAVPQPEPVLDASGNIVLDASGNPI